MTEICQQIIDHPAAWTARSIGSNGEGLWVTLNSKQVAAIDELLEKTKHIAPQAVTRSDFDHPDLNGFLAEILDIIKNGRGAVLIKGLDRDRYTDEQCERIYWGFGTHLGRAVIQSTRGDRLGHVRQDPNNTNNRSYRSNREILPHTDANEIVGLMCLQEAESGGESQLVSSLAVHNEILRTRPDLLPPLYEGFHLAIRDMSDAGVTDYKLPLFSMVDGKVSCQVVVDLTYLAAERMKTKLPPKSAEALAYFEKVSTQEDLWLTFSLRPGEIMLCNNFIMLHSRNEYQDSETKKRHLLRLWLDVPDLRPVVDTYRLYTDAYRYGPDKAANLQQNLAQAAAQ